MTDYRVILAIGWGASTTLLPFVVSHLIFSIYQIRANIVGSAGLFLLAAVGVTALGSRIWQMAAIGAVLVASGFAIAHDYVFVHKTPWNRIAALVEARAQPGDLLLVNPGFELDNVYAYYGKRTDLRRRPFPADDLSVKGPRELTSADSQALVRLAREAQGVWLICDCAAGTRPEALLDKPLAEVFKGREVFRFEQDKYVIHYWAPAPS